MGTLRNLLAYKKAFKLAMEIFYLSKGFPKEEQYSLTSQIRRCTRSVNTNLGEAYRKRRYPNYFVSKVSDADMENAETQVWLEFALASEYISIDQYNILNEKCEEVAKLLVYMMNNPEKIFNKQLN
jgi:four helix bundle protein